MLRHRFGHGYRQEGVWFSPLLVGPAVESAGAPAQSKTLRDFVRNRATAHSNLTERMQRLAFGRPESLLFGGDLVMFGRAEGGIGKMGV